MSLARFRARIAARILRKKSKKIFSIVKQRCRFCDNPSAEKEIDYKNVDFLKEFLSERKKIVPSRVSGACSYHQRQIAKAIKTARAMALLPFCPVKE